MLRNFLGGLGNALALPADDLGQGAPPLAVLVDRALVRRRKPGADDIVIPSLARLELLDASSRPRTQLGHRCLARSAGRAGLEQEELDRLVRVVLRSMCTPCAQPGVGV